MPSTRTLHCLNSSTQIATKNPAEKGDLDGGHFVLPTHFTRVLLLPPLDTKNVPFCRIDCLASSLSQPVGIGELVVPRHHIPSLVILRQPFPSPCLVASPLPPLQAFSSCVSCFSLTTAPPSLPKQGPCSPCAAEIQMHPNWRSHLPARRAL